MSSPRTRKVIGSLRAVEELQRGDVQDDRLSQGYPVGRLPSERSHGRRGLDRRTIHTVDARFHQAEPPVEPRRGQIEADLTFPAVGARIHGPCTRRAARRSWKRARQTPHASRLRLCHRRLLAATSLACVILHRSTCVRQPPRPSPIDPGDQRHRGSGPSRRSRQLERRGPNPLHVPSDSEALPQLLGAHPSGRPATGLALTKAEQLAGSAGAHGPVQALDIVLTLLVVEYVE